MNVKWLFETDIFDENIHKLVKACETAGLESKICANEHFGQNKTYLDLFKPDDCVVTYTSLEFAAQIRREAKWIPGSYCNLKNYECTSYYPQIGADLLNCDYIMLPFGELSRRRDYLFDVLGTDGCFFVRPNRGNKIFTGKLIERERYDRELTLLGFYEVQPDELVVAAEPQNVTGEYRFVVADNKIVAGSQYRNNGGEVERSPDVPLPALEMAERYAHLSPDRAWCIDVCYRKHYDDYKIMEINSFGCSGLYECDPDSVVRAVSKTAWKEYEEYK